VPHFEKMLYDQAQLVLAYLEAFERTAEPLFRRVALETLAYVQRELADEAGGFCSAEDADSRPAGAPAGEPAREGAFYVWAAREITGALGGDAEPFALRFGIDPNGNPPHDPHGEFHGQTSCMLRAPSRKWRASPGAAERTSAPPSSAAWPPCGTFGRSGLGRASTTRC